MKYSKKHPKSLSNIEFYPSVSVNHVNTTFIFDQSKSFQQKHNCATVLLHYIDTTIEVLMTLFRRISLILRQYLQKK